MSQAALGCTRGKKKYFKISSLDFALSRWGIGSLFRYLVQPSVPHAIESADERRRHGHGGSLRELSQAVVRSHSAGGWWWRRRRTLGNRETQRFGAARPEFVRARGGSLPVAASSAVFAAAAAAVVPLCGCSEVRAATSDVGSRLNRSGEPRRVGGSSGPSCW